MKTFFILLTVLTFSMAIPALAEEPMTKSQGDAIMKELKEIRRLLERQQRNSPPQARKPEPEQVDVTVGLAGHVLGNENAPLTLVEFTDYECPYCRRFHESTFPQLKKNYIDTGKVKFVSRNLPLPFHKHAKKAAQAALCAGDQGKYWEMRDIIFKNSHALEEKMLSDYAESLKLNMSKFNSCLDSNKHLDKLHADLKGAQSAAITGTPSFVLGKSVNNGDLTGEKIVGAQPYPVFEAEIKKMLKEQ